MKNGELFPAQLSMRYPIWAESKKQNGDLLKFHLCYNGYYALQLTDDAGGKVKSTVHRLVAKVFIPPVEGKEYVDHINRNPLDNRVENLRWCTVRENSLNKNVENCKGSPRKVVQYEPDGVTMIRVWESAEGAARGVGLMKGSSIIAVCRGKLNVAAGYVWKYHEVEILDEQWMPLNINDTDMEISSHGRVKYPSGRITSGALKHSYRKAKINHKTFGIHRLVCMAFKPNDNHKNLFVNHIDNDPTNNTVNNLEWCTAKENVAHGIKFTNHFTKSVNMIDAEGNVLETFGSVTEAAKKYGLTTSEISAVCKGKRKSVHKKFFRYAD